MSESLDRRIATEVMGEQEPPPSTEHFNAGIRVHSLVFRENWSPCEIWDESGDFVRYGWQPAPFSSSLEEAERALRHKLYELGGRVTFALDEQGWVGWDGLGNRGQTGPTLPEAICNLLLALRTEKK